MFSFDADFALSPNRILKRDTTMLTRI